jgi:hypothetical protein
LPCTAQHVETTVRCFRRAQQAEELSREARQLAARRVSYSYDDDGSLILRASLPAETGALLVKALDAAMDAMELHERKAARQQKDKAADEQQRDSMGERKHRGAERSEGVSAETSRAGDDDPTPGEQPTRSMRRADALARVAESFLAHGAEVLPAGDRYQVVVHVDEQTLREGCAGRCEQEDGPAVPMETARRFACDASKVSIVDGADGEPLSVGRKTRTIPSPIRRALNSRDRGCRFPGCPNRHYVDGHHIHHWANGGETRLSNLVLLCRFHHRQVHEGGVAVHVLDDGALRFVTKEGREFDSPLPARPGEERGARAPDVGQGDWTALGETHDANGLVITPDTAVTRWRGEGMNYGIAVDALLYRSHHAEHFRGNA